MFAEIKKRRKDIFLKFLEPPGIFIQPSQTPTPTITPSITPSPTVTPSITPSMSVTPTNSVTPTVTPSITPSMSVTPTLTPTITPTITASITPSPTVTPSTTPPPPFISVWRTTAPNENITLPYSPTGTYSGTINWGDGNVSANTYANRSHTYASSGNYTVTILGVIEGWSFATYSSMYRTSIREILQWGPLRGEGNSNAGMFDGCTNLVLTGVTDTPDLVGIQSLTNMFNNCSSITTVNNMNSWNTSSVVDMVEMFEGATLFNQNIGNWDVLNVTDMSSMFYFATSFNNGGSPSISSWNVSNVINMGNMFAEATSFNQPLSSWNVSNVTDMSYMFYNATNFNQNIGGWNVSNVVKMRSMFKGALVFNNGGSPSISGWNVSNVNNANNMFEYAMAFNQNIGSWNWVVNKCFGSMFEGAVQFNNGGSPSISGWNVSLTYNFSLPSCNSLNRMFKNAISFNQNLNMWCVSGYPGSPTEFDFNTTSWTGGAATRPQWGTCP